MFSCLIIISLCFIHLSDYFMFRIEFALGLALLGYTLYKGKNGHANRGMRPLLMLLCLGFASIHLLHYSRSFLCISLLMYVFYVLDGHGRKIELYHLVTGFVMLPFFQFFENSISIPLRLQLSDSAVALLRFLDPSCQGAGNLIIYMNKAYLVDTGCAGLKMLKMTLLFAGCYMFMFQQKHNIRYGIYGQMLVYLLFIALNLMCNLIRIIALVMFDVSEKSMMHDLLGCLCLILYVLLPSYVLLHQLSKRFNGKKNVAPVITPSLALSMIAQPCCLVLFTFFIFHDPKPIQYSQQMALEGFKKQQLKGGITSYSDGTHLVYYKAVPSVFSLEHNPTVCWSTEGFLLKQINKEYVAGVQVYTGEFVKGTEHVYAAWWFSSGSTHTIDNFEWRYEMLFKRKSFVFLNVNTTSREQLKIMVEKLMDINKPSGMQSCF